MFYGLRFRADQQLNARLDGSSYLVNETIELKIPVTLPYPIHEKGFQRTEGRFEHHGEFFKLVKHKLQDDTLYVVCIRDQKTKHLVNTMTNYLELTQAIPASGHKALNLLSKLLKDYYSTTDIIIIHQNRFSMTLLFHAASEFFPSLDMPVQSPPPEI